MLWKTAHSNRPVRAMLPVVVALCVALLKLS